LEKKKPTYFTAISSKVRYSPLLKANEKHLVGEIDTLSNKTGWCIASNKYFAWLFDTNDKTVSRWIKNLHKNGFIEIRQNPLARNRREMKVTEEYRSGVRFYMNGDEKVTPSDEKITPSDEKVTEGSDEKVTHNILLIINKSLRENLSNKTTDIRPILIMDYLNEKSPNEDYGLDDDYLDMIYELLDAGRSIDDFKTVIDKKCLEWIGTPHMEQWLWPDTLFQPNKFKKYLKQPWPKKIEPQENKPKPSQPKGNFAKFGQRDKASLGKLVSLSREAERRERDDAAEVLN